MANLTRSWARSTRARQRGKLVNDESFLKNAKMSLQKLDKATDSLEDQGPLSVLASRSALCSDRRDTWIINWCCSSRLGTTRKRAPRRFEDDLIERLEDSADVDGHDPDGN